MEDFLHFTYEPTRRFLWVLVHSFWQGGTILLILKVALSRIPCSRPQVRYVLCLTALAGMALCSALTWEVLSLPATTAIDSGSHFQAPSQDHTPVIHGNGPSVKETPTDQDTHGSSLYWPQLLTGLWALGALLMLLHTGHILNAALFLRKTARPVQDLGLLKLIQETKDRLRIKHPLPVLESEHISTPGVLGVIRPALMIPVTMTTGLNAEQWRAVLAHELGHIRRKDFLINVFQLIFESLYYFNPFAWMISRQVRLEREACCDVLAIETTGQRLPYAELLAEVQTALYSKLKPGGIVLQNFGDGPRSHSTLDRVRRILDRHYRSSVRVHWSGFLCALSLTSVLVAALHIGSKGAVALTAQILSDKERIEKIESLNETHSGGRRKTYTEQDKITVRGRLNFPDGIDLGESRDFPIFAVTIRPGYMAGYSIGINDVGEFEQELHFGDVFLGAELPGWAPSFQGPLATSPGGVIEGVDLSFQQGFRSSIQVVDDLGVPVAGVDIEITFQYMEKLNGRPFTIKTDSDGVIELNHCALNTVALVSLSLDGFEEVTRRKMELVEGGQSKIQMKSTPSIAGMVVDKTNGRGVSRAGFRPVLESRGSHSHSYGFEEETLIETDSKGRYQLNSLAGGTVYYFIVEAPGYQPEMVGPITTREQGPLVELDPAIVFQGRLTGSQKELRTNRMTGKEYVRLHQTIRVADHSMQRNIEVEVDTDGEGIKRFQTESLMRGKVALYGKDLLSEWEVLSPMTSLVLDLDKEPETLVTDRRPVMIHLIAPDDAPPPKGYLAVRALVHRPTPHYPMPLELEVADGRVELEVESPGEIRIEPYGLIGYWPVTDYPSSFKIPDGNTALEIEIPLKRAGAVYGSIKDSQGKPVEEARIHLTAVKQPDVKDAFMNLSDLNNHFSNLTGARYHVTPVPFGGVYRMIAYLGFTYVVSEPFELNKENPVVQLDFTLPEGVDGGISIRYPSGEPAADIPLRFSYSTPFNQGFSSGEYSTNDKGEYIFEGLNPSAPGEYKVEVLPVFDFQPAVHAIDLAGRENVIRLEKGLSASGRLLNAKTGKPLSGVVVSTFSPHTIKAEGPTDQEGRFHFSNLGPGQYHLRLDGIRQARYQPMKIQGGTSEEFQFSISIMEN